MRAPRRGAVLGSALLALSAAEAGARLLAPRETLPVPVAVDLRDHFSEAEIEWGARYARPQLALALARSGVQLGVLVAAARQAARGAPANGRVAGGRAVSGRLMDVARAVPRLSRGTVARSRALKGAGSQALDALRSQPAQGAGIGAALAVATTALPVPLAAVARRRSLRVGLATQSWAGWSVDLVKSTAIESVFAAAGGALLTVVAERYPRHWWAPAAAGMVAVGALLGALAPVALDPLFNDFTPLPEGDPRREVVSLAQAAGVRVGDVYSVDASRRTTAANAYVTGLGPTKRVVLFDTLLDRYSRAEVLAVVAHELAHVRHRDVARSVAYAAIVAGPTMLASQRLSAVLGPGLSGAWALPARALAAMLVAAPTGLLGNRLSRAVERRADAFALRLSPDPAAFVSFERAIALQNVADVDPPQWVMSVLATHPSIAERIGMAAAVASVDGRAVTPPESRGTRGGS